MSQRVAKVESVIQQAVAQAMAGLLEGDGAAATVTRVDAAGDLRNAVVWVGLLGAPAEQDRIWARVEAVRPGLQAAISGKFTMKFTPRLHLRRDSGGEYAEKIERLLRDI